MCYSFLFTCCRSIKKKTVAADLTTSTTATSTSAPAAVPALSPIKTVASTTTTQKTPMALRLRKEVQSMAKIFRGRFSSKAAKAGYEKVEQPASPSSASPRIGAFRILA